MMERTISGPPEVGALTLVAGDNGLLALLWNVDGEDRRVPLDGERGESSRAKAVLDEAERQLTQYFNGERTEFDLPLDPAGTEFQLQAWQALQAIPFGETRSYRQQAEIMNRPSAVRAVGSANGRNPLSIIVPCHRVVGADGSLTGFAAGVEVKRFLLDHERRVSGRDVTPTLPGG